MSGTKDSQFDRIDAAERAARFRALLDVQNAILARRTSAEAAAFEAPGFITQRSMPAVNPVIRCLVEIDETEAQGEVPFDLYDHEAPTIEARFVSIPPNASSESDVLVDAEVTIRR